MSYREHKREAPGNVGCAILTVSDTRDKSTDTSGQLIRELLERDGHQVMHYAVVKDSPLQIKGELAMLVERKSCQAILLNGGTGIAARDNTYDTVSRMLQKRLDGFGELFRYLSYQEIGPSAMLSRAVAGTLHGRVVVSMPGSRDAVRLAMEKLILPELSHMVHMVSPHR